MSVSLRKPNNALFDKTKIYYALAILVFILIQFLIVKFLKDISPIFIILTNVFLAASIFIVNKPQKLLFILFLLNFLPLLYLNNSFHYAFSYEVFLDISLFLLLGLVGLTLAKKNNLLNLRFSNIEIPMIMFLFYAIILAIWGLLNGNNKYWIVVELYHFFYYAFFFVILYIFKKREQYINVVKLLVIIFILIAFEYIVYNFFISNIRFVTFQSGFLPFISAICFAYILIAKNKTYKLIGIILLLICLFGLVVTLTRALWITSFISLFTVYFMYHKFIRRKSIKIFIPFIILFLMVPVLLLNNGKQAIEEKTTAQINDPENRAESMSDPTSDLSLLMRVELGYYAVQKFLESPVIGKGLGDFLKYKILVDNSHANYYLDNSWLYMFWKGGIIAAFILFFLYYRIMRSLFFILKNTKDFQVQIMALGFIGGFVGLLVLSLVSPILIKYRTNFMLAFMFAYIQFEVQNIKQGINR